jgi:hypothetical protein
MPLRRYSQNLRRLAKIFPAPQQTRKAREKRRSRSIQASIFCARNTSFFKTMGGERAFAALANLDAM